MRFAVSNIAWGPAEDPVALAYVRDRGFAGVEVAPTRLWPDWDGAGPRAAGAYRRQLEDVGLVCPALQAVLFGLPELQLFGTGGQRQQLAEHLRLVAEIAAALGAGAVVFGSPANRVRDGLASEKAFASATELLRDVGDAYHEHGVKLVIEANPPEYGCDFVTRLEEARALVQAVDSPGVALHADAGAMSLAEEEPALLTTYAPELAYFHVSEPFLEPVGDRKRHAALGRALHGGGYDSWCSVEMRRPGDGLDHVEEAAQVLLDCYE